MYKWEDMPYAIFPLLIHTVLYLEVPLAFADLH